MPDLSEHAGPALMAAVHRFAAADLWVRHWQDYPDVDDAIDDLMPECDEMSARFADCARAVGLRAAVVRVEPDPADPVAVDEFLPPHWLTLVLDGGVWWAVDWTARQHWNVRTLEVDPAEIPCPMVWVWDPAARPRYPLTGVPYDGLVVEVEG